MKLRVKVDGRAYEVEVEGLEHAGLGAAASRVESSPIGTVPKPPASMSRGRVGAPAATVPAAAPSAKPERPRQAMPWHGVAIGPSGECLAPVPGTIRGVLVKPGQAVKAGEPLLNIEVSAVLSPQKRPLVGTVRTVASGVVAEITVREGEPVHFGQMLVRFAAAR